MDFIIVFGIGAILVATGVVSPKPKDDEILEEVKAVKTEEIVTPSPEPEPEPEPVPEPEPEPEPEPATEPEPTSEPQKEEPKEQINSELIQEQDAKPEEEEVTIVAEEKVDATEENGISVLNIILYILGAIAVIAAGIYFFMRRDPAQSAADIAREQTSLETSPEPEEETKQEEPHSEPEPKEPAQEGTQTESTQEETPSDNTDNSSSNEDENNNK